MSQTAVVIPNWNGREWLPGCLDSLAAQSVAASEVIVVDNGSTDGSAALLRESYPWVRLIELGHNTGFAFACNRGVEAAAGADHVALVNTDVELAGDWLALMAAALDASPGAASAACKMVDLEDPGVIYDAGDVLRRDGACDQRGRFLRDDGRWDEPGEVWGACAGAALYRRDAFLAAGGFDERFFAYLEDIDLGLTLRLSGATCAYEPRAVARHAGGGTSAKLGTGVAPWVERNTLLIVAKYFPLRWLPLVLYRQAGWAWGGDRRAFFSGVRQALPLLPRYALRERPAARRRARISIEEAVPATPIRGPQAAGYEASRGSSDSVDEAARSRWDEFARRDAQYYIDPTLGPGADVELFLEGGRLVVDRAVDWAGPVPTPARALEIGSGIGRGTVHLASHFAEVHGVDVSETMVRSAQERGLPDNVTLHVGSGRDLGEFESASFDLVFSHLVFQHIPDEATVASYIREIGRVLRPGGVAVTQFDTRPPSLVAAAAQRLPDALLPRKRRREIRRYRRSAVRLREFGREAGLTIEDERDPDTEEHWFRWRRPVRALASKE